MRKAQVFKIYFCLTSTFILWSSDVISADWPDEGTTIYVTHFIVHPTSTIDAGSTDKIVSLEMVGTTTNTDGGNLMDKLAAQCSAIQVISKDRTYIDGGCVLADKDGDKIFSTFDTREITLTFEKNKPTSPIPKYTCGTHLIVNGTGKYKGMTGKEPFSCSVLPTVAAEGWSGMDIEHQLSYKFK